LDYNDEKYESKRLASTFNKT